MVLQDRDEPPGGGQGSVEGGGETGFAVLGAVTDVQAAGLAVGAVGGGGQLPVGALGGDPRLTVVLARGAGTQVPTGDVPDPVGRSEERRVWKAVIVSGLFEEYCL